MAWPKLYHRQKAGILDPLCFDWGTWSGRSAEETFRPQIFIEVWPVNAVSSTGDFPIVELFNGRMKKAWIPH
jgi:hypothetical protein